MKITERRVYRGPSLYAHFPVIRLTVDLGPLEDHPSGKIDGFTGRLLGSLPSLQEHGCSYGTHGGFVRRLDEDGGTWMGHVLEHMTIELQRLAGAQVTFGKTRGTGVDGEYHVVYSYDEERVGLAAADLALEMVHQFIPTDLRGGVSIHDDFDFSEQMDELITYAQTRQFGPSTASLIAAAEERDIPWMRLNDYSLVQMGHGKFQKRIQATITSETKHIAVDIASDKEETNKILSDLGLPVPAQALFRSVREGVRCAKRIGYPVVVKPFNGNHGRGVSLNITNAEEMAAAVEKAREHARTLVVEKMLVGFDHRMLVVDGKLIAVAKRVPGHVIGDGKHTIAELVDIVNLDPRRGIGHEKVLTRLEIDYQAKRLMADDEVDESTVLAAGRTFYLRATANLSTGGTAIDLTDLVHHDNREMAMRAAKAIGLDVAGVDFMTPDITKSYREVGGGICEVNAAPGFRMHVAPTEGTPRDVAGPVLDMLFPPQTPSRIPIVGITGTNGKTTTARMVAHILKMSGSTVGLTTTDGVYVDGERTAVGDMTGPKAAQMVLRDPTVDAAVLETARGGMLRAGLGYRECDVGAVLNVSADHLGLRGINTVEQLAEVKRVVVEVARDCAVLNGDDILCLKMAAHSDANRIAYFTMNPKNRLVHQHIQAGGLAAVLEEGINGHMITLYDEGSHLPLLWTYLIPATLEGKAMHNVQNAMVAALLTYALGIKVENIRQGLRTFDTSYFQVPGRMNIFDELPFKVILDYGHNPAAVQCMVDLVGRLDVEGDRTCVLSAPGDRRDEDILQIASIVAKGSFERVIVRRDDNTRGRGDTEVPDLLRKGLIEGGFNPDHVITIIDEQEAVAAALDLSERGDLVLIFGDAISRCWKQIITHRSGPSSPKGLHAVDADMISLDGPATPTGMSSAEFEALIIDERGVRLARESSD